MTKLFLTLYVAIIVTIALFVLGVNKFPERLLSSLEAEYDERVFKGTFALLDEAIAGRSGAELDTALDEISRKFGYPIELLEQSSVKLERRHQTLVDQGKTASVDVDDVEYLYKKSNSIEQRIWFFAIDQTKEEDASRQAIGTFELVQDKLAGKDSVQQAMALRKLKPVFGFPVQLIRMQDFAFTEQERERLLQGELIARKPDDDGEQYFMQLRGTNQIISGGPIHYPAIVAFLPFIVLAILALLLALVLYFWIWPLWRDLKKLRLASARIGEGNLDSRIESSRSSMIGSVIDGFNNMAERTQNMITSQKELTNAVSHELRTPVARLKFGLEMLRDAKASTDQTRHINNMAYDVSELEVLLNELLTYARYEHRSTNHQLENHDLHGWLLPLVERTKRQTRNIDLNLEFKGIRENETTLFEPRLIGRAVSNGLQNALRYANSLVNILLFRDVNDYVIHIDDDGPGVSEEQRERVFEAFTRVDESRNRESGGFGLGLPIVAKAIAWHGGTASLHSSPLGGARLELRWPAK